MTGRSSAAFQRHRPGPQLPSLHSRGSSGHPWTSHFLSVRQRERERERDAPSDLTVPHCLMLTKCCKNQYQIVVLCQMWAWMKANINSSRKKVINVSISSCPDAEQEMCPLYLGCSLKHPQRVKWLMYCISDIINWFKAILPKCRNWLVLIKWINKRNHFS